jgi:hypothetical protein
MGELIMRHNRLTVVGEPRPLRHFRNHDWLPVFAGGHWELLELSPDRFACQFETVTDPLPALQRLSRSHPELVFLLAYETARCQGLAKAKAGRLIQHRIRY